MQPLKLVVVGPIRSGKTTVSNFLADATEMVYDYHPTRGARILEFEVENVDINNKRNVKDVELWDCSGDYKYEHCWPAMRKNLQGVVIVYSEKSSSIKEIQQFYNYFVDQTKLGPDRCAIFCFDPEKKNPEVTKIISSTFAKVSHVRCNVEDGGNKLKADFSSFISSLVVKIQDYKDHGKETIISDNILISK